MPRKSRIDAPGALQHVIGRGINRQAIFSDKADYKDFLYRLGEILSESNTSCYAWALMPNHFHLLLRMGMEMSPEEIMERGREKRKVEARSILCYWATDSLGISQRELAKRLKLTQPAVSQVVRVGFLGNFISCLTILLIVL